LHGALVQASSSSLIVRTTFSPPHTHSAPSPFLLISHAPHTRTERVLVIVRDARGHMKHILGVLRSFDHFGTIVLEGAVERIVFGGKLAERRRGVCVVRGENVFMIGEVDERKDATMLEGLETVDFAELEKTERRQWEAEMAATKTGEPLFDDL